VGKDKNLYDNGKITRLFSILKGRGDVGRVKGNNFLGAHVMRDWNGNGLAASGAQDAENFQLLGNMALVSYVFREGPCGGEG
jgi:hypothetical protein